MTIDDAGFLISRYSRIDRWRGGRAPAPIEYPDVGIYHPDIRGHITTDPAQIPKRRNSAYTVGLLLMRSYVLSSDTAHYDAVIRSFEAKGMRVIPAYASGLDGRPAITRFL